MVMKYNIENKIRSLFRFTIYSLLPLIGGGWVGVSCSDFFEQESDHVIYSDQDHLTNWSDTVYSMTGVLSKLQVIADRTILLGEVRGDLVTLTSEANSDLRDIAAFNVGDDNKYNVPRDYYAIINNCNYFIAKADTALKSNRNQYIFMKEYAAIKAIRAWTYLQLALNYGSVPFVTEPILTKDDSEREYPRYQLADICQYFLNDLATLPERYDNEYPDYGTNVRGNHSRLFFFPLNVIRGELYLWLGSTKGTVAGKNDFENAAVSYFKYLTERNGLNSAYPMGIASYMWAPGYSTWTTTLSINNPRTIFSNENYGKETEFITLIPGDSIRAEGNYSELRNLFNSTEENDYKVSINPSTRLIEISEAQTNTVLTSNGMDYYIAPKGLSEHMTGDLRLSLYFDESYRNDRVTGNRIDIQTIRKYNTRNVHIYRRQMIYLRLAEALNLAGQPRIAYKILSRGLSNRMLTREVYPYTSQADSVWMATHFDFPDVQYKVLEAEDLAGTGNFSDKNMIGIHTHGSGWTPMNPDYQLVGDTVPAYRMLEDSTIVFDEARYEQVKKLQQAQVDSLILTEAALELSFEGTRFYDLMRFAMRSDNPGQFMADHIYARRGQDNVSAVQAEIRNNLTNQQNWYLKWKGKVGF